MRGKKGEGDLGPMGNAIWTADKAYGIVVDKPNTFHMFLFDVVLSPLPAPNLPQRPCMSRGGSAVSGLGLLMSVCGYRPALAEPRLAGVPLPQGYRWDAPYLVMVDYPLEHPLHAALAARDWNHLHRLVVLGADILGLTERGVPPLFEAAQVLFPSSGWSWNNNMVLNQLSHSLLHKTSLGDS